MNKVVHFELPTDDLDRAKKFYESVFGWKMDAMGGDVVLVTTTESDEKGPKEPGAINGDIYKRTEKAPHPLVVLDVESIEEHARKIEAAGGKATGEKTEIPGMGYYGYFTDPEGNVLGLWEIIKK